MSRGGGVGNDGIEQEGFAIEGGKNGRGSWLGKQLTRIVIAQGM